MSDEEITQESDEDFFGRLGIEPSPEDLEAVNRLREQFGFVDEDPSPPEEPVEGEPETEPEEEPEEEPPSPPAAPDSVLIDGREVPIDEVRSMVQLQQYLREHPSQAERVGKVIRGEQEPEPEPPLQPPAEFDLEDPRDKAIWDSFVAISERLKKTEQTAARVAEQTTASKAQADVAAGLSRFRADHPELSEADIDTLRRYPLTIDLIGMYESKMPGPDAVVKALDLAALEHPTFRARARGEETAQEKRARSSAEKKQKLGALSGSSGSAARSEPKPDLSSDASAKRAAADWLRSQNLAD